MSLQNLTLPQALVFIACLAAMVASYKLLGTAEATAVTGVVGMVVSFLLGRQPPSPGAPALPAGPAA